MFVSSCLCLKYFSEGRAIEKKNRLRKFKIAHRGNFKNLLKLLLVARIQHRLILHLGCKLPWLCLRDAMSYIRKISRTGASNTWAGQGTLPWASYESQLSPRGLDFPSLPRSPPAPTFCNSLSTWQTWHACVHAQYTQDPEDLAGFRKLFVALVMPPFPDSCSFAFSDITHCIS